MKNILLTLIVVFSVNVYAGEIHRTDTELVDKVYASWGSPYELYVVYSIGPINLKQGDIVDLRVQAEFTNDCHKQINEVLDTYNVGLGRYITKAYSASDAIGDRVVKSVMQNITRDVHHGVVIQTGLDKIEYAQSGVYYNFVVFAAANNCAGKYLDVEGYGSSGYGEFMLEIR